MVEISRVRAMLAVLTGFAVLGGVAERTLAETGLAEGRRRRLANERQLPAHLSPAARRCLAHDARRAHDRFAA